MCALAAAAKSGSRMGGRRERQQKGRMPKVPVFLYNNQTFVGRVLVQAPILHCLLELKEKYLNSNKKKKGCFQNGLIHD